MLLTKYTQYTNSIGAQSVVFSFGLDEQYFFNRERQANSCSVPLLSNLITLKLCHLCTLKLAKTNTFN